MATATAGNGVVRSGGGPVRRAARVLAVLLTLAAGACGEIREGDAPAAGAEPQTQAVSPVSPVSPAATLPRAPVQSHPAPSRSPVVVPGTPRPTCVGGLSVTVGGFDAASGLRALGVRLTNCGSSPYRVKGQPSVRLLDADRRPFEIAVNSAEAPALPEQYQGPAPEVVLQPGESAAAMVLWRNTLTDYTTATIGTYLEVVPAPGQAGQLLTEHGPYDTGNTARLRVSHWIRGGPPR